MTFLKIKNEQHSSKKKRHILYNFYHRRRIWFHIVGIGCIIWFLFRVLPKPDRFRYPCQQMSITVAMSYIAFWTVLLTGLGLWIKKTKYKATTIFQHF